MKFKLDGWGGELPREEWRPLPNNAGYFASSLGRVLSTKRGRAKLLKDTANATGYKQVCLSEDNKPSCKKVHRLVLEAFAGSCPDGMQGSHKDGNPSNNHITNLKWETPTENAQRKNDHGTMLRGEKCYLSKLNESDIPKIRSMVNSGEMQKDVAKRFGIKPSGVSLIMNGKIWKHVK